MTHNLNVPVDTETLVQALVHDLKRSDVIELIKRLDEAMEDWDCTLELVQHFKDLERQYEEEEGVIGVETPTFDLRAPDFNLRGEFKK